MSTKMWKHEGKWRFMATLGKMRRAVLEVPFDADREEAQAIADSEAEAQAAIEANYHPWEVKEEKKPKAAVVEWEYVTTCSGPETGDKLLKLPVLAPVGVGWEMISSSCLMLKGDFQICWQWRRPKP